MLTPHISVVQVPVNAIGKKRSRVFFFPKLSLNFICFGPSPALVGNVTSGALVPTVSGITNAPVDLTGGLQVEDRHVPGKNEDGSGTSLNRESLNRHRLP